MNQDHQSDRQSINSTTPPIFNPQGKSTLAHLQKDFCPRQKLLIPRKKNTEDILDELKHTLERITNN